MTRSLQDALIAAYTSPAATDAEAQRRALRSWGFTPDEAMEAMAARRRLHPEAAEPVDLAEALYIEAKAAAAAKET